jgi:CBS domain-containing membrane protein
MKFFFNYIAKMKGGKRNPRRAPLHEIFWSALGSFLGILSIYFVGHLQELHLEESLFLVGSFGASAVLLYGIPNSPYAQPRNLILGHLLSALVGVSCAIVLQGNIAIAAAAAVSLSVVAMHFTRSVHPPGGATALIAVVGGSNIHALSYWYVITPIGLGAALMLFIALVVNNLSPHRRYPQYWY